MPMPASERDFNLPDGGDLAVIGAGPAGLAAAITAADAGLIVTVFDLGERIGGQYYRHSAGAAGVGGAALAGPFHHGWSAFVKLRSRFASHVDSGRITHLAGHSVWSIEAPGPYAVIRAVEGERERRQRTVSARTVILATGAHDRHVPFPGWTLPGVMAAGGAQALLKGSLVAPGRRAVVAGTGPFLLPVADGLLAAGIDVAEIVEANRPWGMARHPGAAPNALGKVPELMGYGWRLKRAGVRFRTQQAVTAAHGNGRLQAVTVARIDARWRVIPGTERELECDLLAVGYGFTPQVEVALAAGCRGTLAADGSLVIATDQDGRTSVAGIYAAGETTGVGGSDLAMIEGSLCGQTVAADLGFARRGDRSTQARLQRKARSRRRFAAALHAVHPVRDGWTGWLNDETLVCRCEEVPYARVRAVMDELGAGDARTVKLLARPGMGWCQGRICGSSLATLAAAHRGGEASVDDLTAMSRRTLGQPVPLSHLASPALHQPSGSGDRRDRID